MKNVKIKNFKGLKVVDVSTDRNMILIYGKNGAGKSSFCDAVMTALSGKDKAIVRPIRNGADRSSIEIELDGYVVRQYFSQTKAPALSITPIGKSEGIKAPKTWLNEHIGNTKLDPSEFAKMDENKQRELLMELAGLNLEENDAKINELYQDRLLIGRELKNMVSPSTSEYEAAKKLKDKELLNISEMMETLNEQTAINQRHKIAQATIENNKKRIEEFKSEIAKLEADNLELEKLSPSEVNTEEISGKINNTGEINKSIEMAKATFEKYELYKKKEAEYDNKEKWLDIERNKKKEKIDNAAYPIDGLSVSEDGVMYNNVPFSQISDSQKIVIGSLIAIALMPKENSLKVIFIKTGSLLDDKALAYLEKVASEKDVQFAIELVGEGKNGFHVVEGEIIDEYEDEELEDEL